MATGEQSSPLKSKKISSSSRRTRNDSDTQWLLIPNNLELGARAKPSKKQRNKEKHRHIQKENLSSSSDVAEVLSCKPRSSYQDFSRVKSNTALWLKDQFINEEKSKRGAYDSEEVFSDSDFPQSHQQNVHFHPKQAFPDVEHQEHPMSSSHRSVDNDNIKSVKDELQKKENAMVCDLLSNIQDFISEAESSWQKLDFSDEPVINDAFVKLKNAVKDAEGGRENKLLQQVANENGYANDVSPSSSTSRASNSKENIVNRDSSVNATVCNGDEHDKCNHHLHETKACDERTESLSSDDVAIANVGERVAAVEWERRKLKNKLVELKEEKKMKDELLRELYNLKDCATTVTSGDTRLQKAKDKKKKKLQPSCQHLKMTKVISADDSQKRISEPDTTVSRVQLTTRQSRSSASLKRDNVRKEQNSSFPARRHYEAEGRANEDPDIPAAPVPPASPALDNPEIQEKIKRLKVAQQHVKVIKDIVVSILENRNSGSLIPIEQLRLLTPLQNVDQYISDEGSAEESEIEKDFALPVHLSSSEPSATNVKEVCCEGLKSSLIDVDSHKQEELEEGTTDNLEVAVGKKDDLTKLQSQFQQLMQIFPSSDRKNDDPVRSSGEGAYTQKKNPSRNVVPENVQKAHQYMSLRGVPHQDNLQLTRQNIVTMEAQNQNSNSNIHNRDCNSVKKDNINNLSGKMGKLSIQNSMNSSYPDVLTATNNNMDTMSTLSYELNQNHSLPNEIERKTIFDILKRGKKKQKQYDRNQDSKICCNSSIESEPLEGSNSALAVDSTTLAAWGGSSTQENFEENEDPGESLEEPDDEESGSVFDKGSLRAHRSTQYSGQFSNMQQYIESVANIQEKRERNLHHSTYRNSNQPSVPREYQHPAQVLKASQRPMASSNTSGGVHRDIQDIPSCVGDNAEHCNQHLSTKFIQQLKNHIDQLNALCQNQILNARVPSTSVNVHPTPQGYTHVPNTCASIQAAPDITLPCNQQLLLSLSQCYHALYMQQLEIQHLQRCMWHSIDGENSIQQNNLNALNNHEEPSFRPYSVRSWSNPFHPSSHFPPDQISPMTSAAYYPLPIKPYASHSGSPFATAPGSQPARAVIYPTSQNNSSSQETLNNQVPPRTRANNFWDNFRSYSRQNLLSTSNNTKRNENIGSIVTPQVRQVYPLVTNESPSRSGDIPIPCCNASSFSDCTRQISNFDAHDALNFSKKAKSNTSSVAGSNSFQKKDVPTNVNSCSLRNVRSNRCYSLNLEPSLVQSISNSGANIIQPQSQVQDNSKIGSFNSASENSLSQSAPDPSASNATSEITHALSGEHKSDFLIGLFHEAQALKSDVLRQKALRMIRDLAMSERHDSDETSQTKVQNDLPFSANKVESGTSTHLHQSCSNQHSEGVTSSLDVSDGDRILYQLLSDTASGNIQNLPTASILPVSKHGTPRTVSTGAVRKKPKTLPACFPETVQNGITSSHDSSGSAADSADPPTVILSKKIDAIEDVPGFVTEKVLADLVSMLPSLKRRLLRDGCSQTFWTFINDYLIDSVRAHLFFYNINLSRKSLLHLRQIVSVFLSLFSGMSLSDFDSEFLKYVEEFIYENITCFVASGQFAPVPSSLDEENCSLVIEDKMQELCVKLPMKPVEPVSTKMSVKMTEESVGPTSMKLPLKYSEDPVDLNMVKTVPMISEKSVNLTSQCGIVTQHNLQNISNCANYMQEPGEVTHVPPEPLFEPEHELPELELGHISPEPELGHISPEPEIEPFEIRCDCNPEAEIEPEVEIGTEADLAEADQSPGQQGAVGDVMSSVENWSLDHEAVLMHRNASAVVIMNGEDIKGIEDLSEGAVGVQLCTDACLDQDAILDDIPTKLYPSEEELPQPLQDEQPVLLVADDDIAVHREFVSENNGDGGSL